MTIKIQLTKKQHELLCECIRYRAADNDMECSDAISHGLKTTYFDSIDSRLSELNDIIYNI